MENRERTEQHIENIMNQYGNTFARLAAGAEDAPENEENKDAEPSDKNNQ